jgi:hypothetical protein
LRGSTDRKGGRKQREDGNAIENSEKEDSVTGGRDTEEDADDVT